jgi:hypothetical protein
MLALANLLHIRDPHHILDVSVASREPLMTGMRRIAVQDAACLVISCASRRKFDMQHKASRALALEVSTRTLCMFVSSPKSHSFET